MDNFVDSATLAKLQLGRQKIGMDGRQMLAMLADLESTQGASPAERTFMSLISDELFEGQWGKNDTVRVNGSSSSDANNDASECVSYPEGLHVDTNNNAKLRSVTCILYLNDIAAGNGGATIFPLAEAAEDDPALGASRELLKEDCMHTLQAKVPLPSVGSVLSVTPLEGCVANSRSISNAATLQGRVDDASVLRIQPRAGRLMIFFTRTDDGEVDPRSWHGGERLRAHSQSAHESAMARTEHDAAVTEKHIMTLFKEVHYESDLLPWPYGYGDQSFESYLAPQIAKQRRHLEDLVTRGGVSATR